VRTLIPATIFLLACVTPSPLVQATGGLPTIHEFQGHFTHQEFLCAEPRIQEAYVAGVLDALALVVAQGEAFAALGFDPRNVYAILYEAIAGIPEDISLLEVRAAVLRSARAQTSAPETASDSPTESDLESDLGSSADSDSGSHSDSNLDSSQATCIITDTALGTAGDETVDAHRSASPALVVWRTLALNSCCWHPPNDPLPGP